MSMWGHRKAGQSDFPSCYACAGDNHPIPYKETDLYLVDEIIKLFPVFEHTLKDYKDGELCVDCLNECTFSTLNNLAAENKFLSFYRDIIKLKDPEAAYEKRVIKKAARDYMDVACPCCSDSFESNNLIEIIDNPENKNILRAYLKRENMFTAGMVNDILCICEKCWNEKILDCILDCKGCKRAKRVKSQSPTCQACSRYKGKRTDWYEKIVI